MSTTTKWILGIAAFSIIGFLSTYIISNRTIVYDSSIEQTENVIKEDEEEKESFFEKITSDKETEEPQLEKKEIDHIKTPEHVRAVYISSWVAGGTKTIAPIIKLIDTTELNAIVIDVKDSTGKISFPIDNKNVSKYGASENRIRDIETLIETLHNKNIYVIGRISVFQDPHLAKLHPELSLKSKTTGEPWKDRKGLSFLDPTNKEVQQYIVDIAQSTYELGFDEVNFDYIRYPSDGNIKDIDYNIEAGSNRADNIEKFFKYLNAELKKNPDIIMSADLFGLTTEVRDDLGIGQVWEKALPYFDYLSPMVYPSHYSSAQSGFKNSSEHPYEIVNKALIAAVKKTTNANEDIEKIRPWLQDFDLGSTYTKDKVRAQMKAVYDNKLDSWMLWDPRNKYTPEALLLEVNE